VEEIIKVLNKQETKCDVQRRHYFSLNLLWCGYEIYMQKENVATNSTLVKF